MKWFYCFNHSENSGVIVSGAKQQIHKDEEDHLVYVQRQWSSWQAAAWRTAEKWTFLCHQNTAGVKITCINNTNNCSVNKSVLSFRRQLTMWRCPYLLWDKTIFKQHKIPGLKLKIHLNPSRHKLWSTKHNSNWSSCRIWKKITKKETETRTIRKF